MNYEIYSVDQLEDELEFLNPIKDKKKIIEIKSVIEEKTKEINSRPQIYQDYAPFTFGGTGTSFISIGSKDIRNDGSYVTTIWFTLLFFPIFPFRSVRIHFGGESFRAPGIGRFQTKKMRLEKVALNKAQIRNVYLSFYGALFSVVGFIWFRL